MFVFYNRNDSRNKTGCKQNSKYNPRSYVILILSLIIFSAYNGGAISVLSESITNYFSLNNTQLGYLMATAQAGGLFALLIIGQLTDKFGPYIVLRLAFVGLGVGYLLCASSLSLLIFVFGQLLIGFFMAGLAISFPSFMMLIYPEYKRKGLSLSLVAFSISGLIAPVFLELMLGRWPDHISEIIHLPYLGLAVFLLSGQFLLTRLPDAIKNGGINETKSVLNPEILKNIFSGPSLLIILLAVLHGIGDIGIYYWLPKYLRTTFDTLSIAPGFILFLYSLMYFFSRLVLTGLPEKSFQRIFLIMPGFIGGSIFLLSLWSGNQLLISLGYPLAAFCWSVEYPVLISEAAECFSEWFSTFFSSTLLSLKVFSMLFISFMGFLSETIGDIRIALTIPGLCFITFSILASLSSLGKKVKVEEGR